MRKCAFGLNFFGFVRRSGYNVSTNDQCPFYFAVGLAIFSILIVWLGSTLVNIRAINALAHRIDDQGKRIDELGKNLIQRIDELGNNLNQRIDELGKNLNQRIDDQGKRIDELDKNLNQRIDELGKSLNQRTDELGNNLNQRIEDYSQSLNLRIDDLRTEMRAGFASVNERLGRLETRFDRIEDEVRKDHENRLARLEARVFSSAA